MHVDDTATQTRTVRHLDTLDRLAPACIPPRPIVSSRHVPATCRIQSAQRRVSRNRHVLSGFPTPAHASSASGSASHANATMAQAEQRASETVSRMVQRAHAQQTDAQDGPSSGPTEPLSRSRAALQVASRLPPWTVLLPQQDVPGRDAGSLVLGACALKGKAGQWGVAPLEAEMLLAALRAFHGDVWAATAHVSPHRGPGVVESITGNFLFERGLGEARKRRNSKR